MPDPVYALAIELTPNSMTTVSSDVLRATYTRTIATALRPLQADNAMFELRNEGGKYTTGRNGAVQLAIGRDIQFTATYGGSAFNLFFGRVERVRRQPLTGDNTNVVVEVVGGGDRLSRAVITTPLFTNINAGSLFTEIMTRANVASFFSDALTDTIPYAWFRDVSARFATDQLIRSGDYRMYVDGAGTVRLRSRYWATTSGTAISSLTEFFSLNINTDTREVINEAKINTIPREQITSPSTIAYISPPFTVPGSGSVGFWLQFLDPFNISQNVPVTSLVTPVASQDYYAAANSDGTGTNYTANISLTMATFGETAVVSLFNGSGNTAYLSRFQLRGYPLRALSPLGVRTENVSSQNVYGKHGFDLDNALIQDYAYIRDYSSNLVSQYKDPVDSIEIGLVNDFTSILMGDVGTTLSIVHSISNVASSWAVQNTSHDISLVDGLRHQTDFRFDRLTGANLFTLDSATLGTLDGPGVLAL